MESDNSSKLLHPHTGFAAPVLEAILVLGPLQRRRALNSQTKEIILIILG